MAIRQKLASGHLCTLFTLGAIGDFSDRQLLERFATGERELAELAFTALVERHGPMVLRVCASILHNPHDAQDAFQATFLVLLRKSPELWTCDSLGPWLHRVARRVAVRAHRSARLRRQSELRSAESRPPRFESPELDRPWSVLHEEIDRLPERLRILVVFCHLQGQSQELAAKTLSLPIGTVKSRLHQARDLLRGRLSRRGFGFSPGLLIAEPVTRAAHALHSLPAYESMVRAMAHAVINRADTTRVVSARAIHLFEETIKTMFVTRMRTAVAITLVAGCLALGAAGVFARQEARQSGIHQPPSTRTPAGKAAGAATGTAAAVQDGTPSYIRRSRSMIIERLERELELAEERLDLTTANIRVPNDPEVLRARKTVERLSGLVRRMDAVLIDAVDEFPTIFDFSATGPGRAPIPKKPEQASTLEPYDEHSLALAAEKLEWSRKMLEKGYRSQGQYDQDKAEYAALAARIDADIARAKDRVDWAERMFEKGYVSKRQYEAEILKHYDALKARVLGARSTRTGESQAVDDELLKNYELYKELLWYTQHSEPKPGTQSKPGTPGAKSPGTQDSPSRPEEERADQDDGESLKQYRHYLKKLYEAPANPDARKKPASPAERP